VSKLAIPSELNRSLDDELLDYPVNGIKEEPLVRTLVRQEPVMVSGFTGHEIVYGATDSRTHICRVVGGR
jgi:hypothetical protein